MKHSATSKQVAKRKRAPRYRIVCEDAFIWLTKRRLNSIHAVVTDPPYGLIEFEPDQLQKRANGNGGIWRLPHNFDGHERRPTPRFTVLGPKEHLAIRRFHTRLSKSLIRVLVPGGHVIIASQTLLAHHVISAFTSTGFELRGQIARMVSTLRGGDRPKFAHTVYADLSVIPRSAWEPWLIFRKPCEGLVRDNLKKWKTGALRRPATDKPFRDCIQSAPARGVERRLSDHPSLKPQRFMRQIVRAALPLGKGLVLDPFAGSGATLAAAESFGFKSIGIEINKEYASLARRVVPKLATCANGDMSPTK